MRTLYYCKLIGYEIEIEFKMQGFLHIILSK